MGVIKPHRFLKREKIEYQAEQLLTQIKASTFTAKKWTNLAESAADFLDLNILWNPFEDQDSGIVAARIYPTERRIEINENLLALHQNQGLYQSTLAHEVGHWMLHVNQDEADGLVVQGELLSAEPLDRQVFLCRKVDEQAISLNPRQTQDDSREWQAQYFASCLLMPRFKIEEVRRSRNLLNWKHLEAIREELGVSKRNLLHRLKDLELIKESGNRLYPGDKLKSDAPLLVDRK